MKNSEKRKQGRPVNPQSARQQRISLVKVIEESKKPKGRPKGSFKFKTLKDQTEPIVIVDVDELINRMDTKMYEFLNLQKEVKMALKFLQLQNQY